MTRFFAIFALILSGLWAGAMVFGAVMETPAGEDAVAVASEKSEKSGVAPYAYELFRIAGLPVTNAMVTSWVISAIIILGIRFLVGSAPIIPTKGQAVVENLVQGVRDLIAPIVGKSMVGPTFPLLLGFFVYILIHNWSGLIPGVGVFGWYDEHGHFDYFMRPANADLNGTLALAIVHFGAWLYFVLKYAGFGTLAYDLFGNKADKREVPGALYLGLFVIFFAVGLIEIISILFRPVSLSFRLFGNVYGGENLLTAMTSFDVGPVTGWFLPIPFYFLELLIGFVQALVFTLLVAVYIGLICNHGDDHEHEAAHGKPAAAH